MRESYGVMPNTLAPAARKVYYIVTRDTAVAGGGDSVSWYLTALHEWSGREENAMRFPQKALASFYAAKVNGVVVERAS